MSLAAPAFFDNYSKIAPRVPAALWWVVRILALLFTLFVIGALFAAPELGLRLFWGLSVPVLPLVLVLAPGLWRQVCPMAFFNQLPRTFGFGLQKTLPEPLRNGAFGVAVAGFVAFVLLRWPLLNAAPALDGAGALLALALALAGGFVFKGRSGWCGTFCALGPIQRVYGQAPAVLVRNGYCATCVGCQKSCYDFNPRAAVFADVYDDDPRYAAQRRLFMGFLPGFILGYFAQGASPAWGEPIRALVILASGAASAGAYGLVTAFAPVNPFRVAAVFSALALSVFYWWSGPRILDTLFVLAAATPPAFLVQGASFVGVLAGVALLGSALYAERQYAATKAPAAARPAERVAVAASGGARAVTDRASGVSFDVAPDASLLDAIRSAGLKINYGCRSGVCGADAVAICEGTENLEPPGEDEAATLRRMGLEGRARLACVCKVRGPVVIDRDPNSAPAAAPAKAAPKADRAKARGLSRVVIVGNGVAGMGVAEALRRDSASLAITIVTNEPAHFYNRMAIGRIVYDGSGMDGLQLLPDAWYASNDVTVMRNTVAARIDRAGRKLILATGEALAYDKLVLASGARAAAPEKSFFNYDNAFALRSADDARALRTYIQRAGAKRAVVIGGGVLGVEAADALRHLGMHVAILQRADRLMNAQLDEEGGAKLADYLDGVGVQAVCNASIASFEGTKSIVAARLAHGPRVRADLFVAALGIDANVFLAKQAGLACGRGVKVDASMATDDPDIYAVGDVAEAGSGPGGLWPVAAAQAKVAAAAMLGEPAAAVRPNVVLRLKCDGVDLYSFGDLRPRPGDEQFTAPSGSDAWWRLIARDAKIAGGVFVGPPGSGRKFAQWLAKPEEFASIRAAVAAGDVR